MLETDFITPECYDYFIFNKTRNENPKNLYSPGFIHLISTMTFRTKVAVELRAGMRFIFKTLVAAKIDRKINN